MRNEYEVTRWTNAEGASPNLGLHSSDHFQPAVWGLRVEQGDVSLAAAHCACDAEGTFWNNDHDLF